MTGSSDIIESRIESALERLEALTHSVTMKQRQGFFGVNLDGDSEELSALRQQNMALKKEIEALKSECRALEQVKNTVSGRLDDTIDELNAILEQ